METVKISGIEQPVSKIGLGTWAIGGWLWGGNEHADSIATIKGALDKGVNLIDTAPVYGFGHAEKVVGEALKGIDRSRYIIATKVGLEWNSNDKVQRNSSPKRIRKEIEDSLQRMNLEFIDLYQIHWPDPHVPFEETAAEMKRLLDEGKIKSVGVSNYNVDQMNQFQKECPIHTIQPPYNIFEKEVEKEILPEAKSKNMTTLAYGALCRGLLSGRMKKDTKFEGDDLRKIDPKFKEPRFEQYLRAVENLESYAKQRFNRSCLHLAVRFLLDRGDTCALWGARREKQLDPIPNIMEWSLTPDDYVNIHKIVEDSIADPVGPEFMAPPPRDI